MPDVIGATAVEFTLSVTDGTAATSDTMIVAIPDSANARITTAADKTIQEGSELTPTCSWTHDSTLDTRMTGADTPSPSFTAPLAGSNTTAAFTLMAADQRSATATDQTTVTIQDVPVPRRSPPPKKVRARYGGTPGDWSGEVTITISRAG